MVPTPFEDLSVSCPECDSPNQFPQGFFRLRSCTQCGTQLRCGLDGMRAPIKPEKIKIVEQYVDPLPVPNVDLGPFEPDPPEGITRCSFCGDQVDETLATRGAGKPQKSIKTEIVRIDGVEVIVEEVKHFAKKVVACPNCCLMVKPITQKVKDQWGNVVGERIVSSGIKWPETDG